MNSLPDRVIIYLLTMPLLAWPHIYAQSKNYVREHNLDLTRIRRRTRQSASLITIVVTVYLWLMAGGATVDILAQADVANATVKGKVMDQFGAGVGSATITLVNAEHRVVRTVNTDGEGNYSVPLLQPGTYDVRIEAT